MLGSKLRGVVAGAVGTIALDIATYVDMSIRGRSSSSAPSKLIDVIAGKLRLPLSSLGAGAQEEAAKNRESGLGALLGYVNGLGAGARYGLLRSQVDEIPVPIAAAAVGLAAMAASDVPIVALRVSNPKGWGIAGWLSDLVPHLIYGIVTVLTYEALSK